MACADLLWVGGHGIHIWTHMMETLYHSKADTTRSHETLGMEKHHLIMPCFITAKASQVYGLLRYMEHTLCTVRWNIRNVYSVCGEHLREMNPIRFTALEGLYCTHNPLVSKGICFQLERWALQGELKWSLVHWALTDWKTYVLTDMYRIQTCTGFRHIQDCHYETKSLDLSIYQQLLRKRSMEVETLVKKICQYISHT